MTLRISKLQKVTKTGQNYFDFFVLLMKKCVTLHPVLSN